MSLPKIAIKTEKTKLPVSGKIIELRPFTVREQKGMLLAVENAKNKDKKEKIQSLLSDFSGMLQSCVMNNVTLTDLTLTDFLMVVMTMRSISVGETARMIYNCSCGSPVEFEFDINKLTCTNKNKKYEKTIKVSNDISITVDIITIKDLLSLEPTSEEDIVLQTIAKSITKISDSETVHLTKDVEESEVMEFVNNLPITTISEIKKVFDQYPTLVYRDTINCPNGKEKLEVVDIQDFFS